MDGAALVAEVRERFTRALEPHFEVEERVLVPVSRGHELSREAERVEQDHAAMRAMVAALAPDGALGDQLHALGDQLHALGDQLHALGDQLHALGDQLHALGERLEAHVRYEERRWFPALESAVPGDDLTQLAQRLRPLPQAAMTGFHQDEGELGITLHPRLVGTVAPERPHHVSVDGGSRFFVRFMRVPTAPR